MIGRAQLVGTPIVSTVDENYKSVSIITKNTGDEKGLAGIEKSHCDDLKDNLKTKSDLKTR